jgi:transcriptional regulator with XRE-family HTH domain
MSNLQVSQQLALLLAYGVNTSGKMLSLSEIARETGIRYQTLSNLLDGTTTNPRLEMLRDICRLFGISLDYFMLETEEDCVRYLKSNRVRQSSTLVATIARNAQQLSKSGTGNVLTIIQWMEATPEAQAVD